MTTKKPARTTVPRATRKTTKRSLTRPVAPNVIYIDTYLKATRDLCDAQRLRHVVINDAAKILRADVSKAEFDAFVREMHLVLA